MTLHYFPFVALLEMQDARDRLRTASDDLMSALRSIDDLLAKCEP